MHEEIYRSRSPAMRALHLPFKDLPESRRCAERTPHGPAAARPGCHEAAF
jgi:hypothetical protein